MIWRSSQRLEEGRLRPAVRSRWVRLRPDPPGPDVLVPKFPSPGEIFVVVAGGRAGRFTCVLPGWLATRNGSRLVTKPIRSATA